MNLIAIPRLRRWRLVTLAVLLLAGTTAYVSVVAAGNASSTPTFGGGDAGVHAPSAGDVSSAPHASDEANGVTVRLTGFAADETRVVVGLAVEGRDELGEGVFPVPGNPIKLVDEQGNSYFENGGSADASDPRQKTIYFPPIPSDTRQLTLIMDGMEFVKRSEPASRSVLDGTWSLTFDVTGQVGRATSVDVSGAAHPLGETVAITIDSVSQAATETVIGGHLSGLSMGEIPELLFHGELQADNETIAFIGLRLGFGPQRSQFEIRFPHASGAVSLHFWAEASAYPRDAAANTSLSQKLGPQPSVAIPLDLPD